MKHYWAIYKEFLSTCFAEATTYRLHFMLLIIMDLLFYLSALGTVEFLFQHISQIGPWGRTEFMFFVAFMIAIDHLHMTFISENFWCFSYDIRTGQLDFILLKPVGSLFVIFFRSIRPATLLNGIFPWAYLIYFGQKLHLGFWQWLFLPMLVLLALTLLVSIEILLSLSMFWIVESMGINFLRMQLQQISRWPDFIYQYYARKFFTFAIPVLMVGSTPVQFLLDLHQWPFLFRMALMMVCIWLIIGVVWRKGLKSYESASS